jgi:type II secretory pathway pseudopilin PulG
MRQQVFQGKIFFFNILRLVSVGAVVVALLISSGGVSVAQLPGLTEEEAATAMILHGLGQAIRDYQREHDSCPPPYDQLTPVTDLIETLGPLGDAPAHHDAWGQPVLYWSDGVDYALVSYGADTVPDEEYADLAAEQFTADDLVWVNEEFSKLPQHFQPAITAGKQKRAMADLRSLATCFHAYAIDNGLIPGSSGAFVPVETFRADFEPVYIRTLLTTDPWGNPFLVISDGAGHYTIVSTGEDGVREEDYDEATARRRTTTASADIVIRDGFFLQWPSGID